MNWILGTLLVLIVIFQVTNHLKKKRILKLKHKLLNDWGSSKEEEYYNFNSIRKYFINNKRKEKAFHIISEKIENDLDIEELFKFIDRTTSKIGQQYLYYKLRTIGSIDDLLKFDSLTSCFLKNKTLRINSQLLLSQLSSKNVYDLEDLLNGLQIKKSKILWLVYLLTLSTFVLLFLGFYNPIFFVFIIPIYIINAGLHFKNKANVNYYLSGVNQLSKAHQIAKKLSEFNDIKNHYVNFSFLKKIENIKLKTAFLGFETNLLSNEYFFAFWIMIESFKILFNIEYIIFNSFIEAVTTEKKSIESLFVFIGELDSAIATASLKSSNATICTPEFTQEKEISVSKITHPLIKDCITNNLNIINKSVLLTGSNMSGKTTFIRTIAINSILAQTLNICFAEKYKAPFFKLYSSIRISDNLLNNTSYYLEEVLTIKKLIDISRNESPCLFVLDEIFKGTNTIERIAGGKGILSYLNKGNNVVLVSTHDIELAQLLKSDNYELYHFSEKISHNELLFDHKLKFGELKTRNAIKILELYNYPKEIITDARHIEKGNFN
jgi:ABC-type molybdenum transport system ATPase subunit/photorepair protein PhrA